jgi:hypothetical protein
MRAKLVWLSGVIEELCPWANGVAIAIAENSEQARIERYIVFFIVFVLTEKLSLYG